MGLRTRLYMFFMMFCFWLFCFITVFHTQLFSFMTMIRFGLFDFIMAFRVQLFSFVMMIQFSDLTLTLKFQFYVGRFLIPRCEIFEHACAHTPRYSKLILFVLVCFKGFCGNVQELGCPNKLLLISAKEDCWASVEMYRYQDE